MQDKKAERHDFSKSRPDVFSLYIRAFYCAIIMTDDYGNYSLQSASVIN
jgi:hypothetical protein